MSNHSMKNPMLDCRESDPKGDEQIENNSGFLEWAINKLSKNNNKEKYAPCYLHLELPPNNNIENNINEEKQEESNNPPPDCYQTTIILL